MNDKLVTKLSEYEENPQMPIELTVQEAEELGAVEDNSMSIEDAIASHGDAQGQVEDAAETAKKGLFLDVPEYYCRGIS